MSLHPLLTQKRYVYNALIKDESETEHILAYALYKVYKNKIITDARNQDWPETRLMQELQSLHDSVIQQKACNSISINKLVKLLMMY